MHFDHIYCHILHLKFKMFNHEIVFISRVVVLLPGISFRRGDIYSKYLMLLWQLHGTSSKTPHTNIFNMAATVIDDI